jgi:hypothetical protein
MEVKFNSVRDERKVAANGGESQRDHFFHAKRREYEPRSQISDCVRDHGCTAEMAAFNRAISVEGLALPAAS